MLSAGWLSQRLAKLTSYRCFCLAYSGGVDSTVLLHLCANLHQRGWIKQLKAIHIHHRLHPEASQWAKACQGYAQSLNIACDVHAVPKPYLKGQSVEDWAREERYRLLFRALSLDFGLLMAHHQSDQAETFLLQALRGSGTYGLAAMPSDQAVIRPLLSVSKAVLLDYAYEHSLPWIDDPTNQDRHLSRNYLRHKIMPMIRKHWPGAEKTLSRAAAHQAQTLTLLDDLATMDLAAIISDKPTCVSISALLRLTPARQRQVIRYWLKKRHLPLPSQKQLEQLFHSVLTCCEDKHPLLCWQRHQVKVEVRRYRDELFIFRAQALVIQRPKVWYLDEPLVLHADCLLHAHQLFCPSFLASFQDQTPTLALNWQHSGQSVKKYFQTQAIPPWWRADVPLFYEHKKWVKSVRYGFFIQAYSHLML